MSRGAVIEWIGGLEFTIGRQRDLGVVPGIAEKSRTRTVRDDNKRIVGDLGFGHLSPSFHELDSNGPPRDFPARRRPLPRGHRFFLSLALIGLGLRRPCERT